MENLNKCEKCENETLSYLAWKRYSAAARSDASPSNLRKLAHDPEGYILKALIKNPNTPADVISKLTSHHFYTVRKAAINRVVELSKRF